MPRFFNSKDLDFIKTIAEEVVNEVVEQAITLYKVSVGETKTNLYGESIGKVYHAPANLMCVVNREPQNVEYENFGTDKRQLSTFSFMRHKLRTTNLPTVRDVNGTEIEVDSIQNTLYGYPEMGDIIQFDNTYFEIDHTKQTKLVGGSPTIYDSDSGSFEDTRMQLIATAFMVRKSQIQINERVL